MPPGRFDLYEPPGGTAASASPQGWVAPPAAAIKESLEISDNDLLRKLRSNPSASEREAALAVLFARHARTVQRRAWHYLDPDVAEALFMEAFTNMMALLDRGLGPRENVRAYLRTSVRNLFVSQLRGPRLVLIADFTDDWPPSPGAAAPGLDPALAIELREAMATLPRRWRQVLWWADVEGQDYAWVGKQLDMTPNAVAVLVFRARRALRLRLEDDHD